MVSDQKNISKSLSSLGRVEAPSLQIHHPFVIMFGRSSVKVLPTNADATLARRRSRTGVVTAAVIAFVIVALLLTIGAFLFSRSVTTQNPNESKLEEALPANAFQSWPNDNDYPKFIDTLKQCLPEKNKHCLKFVPDGATKERIALLRPPGAFGYIFTRFVQDVVDYHWSNTTKLELLPTSHVAPYGYGKTHGFTKIIRLAVSPLMTHGADLLQGDTEAGIQDLKQVVRQLVRWHCRLSHVAAHTSLLTISIESLISEAWTVNEQIRDFLELAPKSDLEHLMDDGFLENDELLARMENGMKDVRKILQKANSEVAQPIEDVIHDVIQDELDKTDNLKQWPCLSFWSVGDEPNPQALTPRAKEVAASFAPNCTAQYAHCGVPRDRCEERGDPICTGKK